MPAHRPKIGVGEDNEMYTQKMSDDLAEIVAVWPNNEVISILRLWRLSEALTTGRERD